MKHATVDDKGELVIFDDDGKKLSKKALAQQYKEAVAAQKRHPLGLYITQDDDDGTRHYWRGDVEVTESEWMQQHPHMRKGNDSGRAGITDGDNGDDGEVSAERSEAKGEGEQGNRQRAAARAAKAQRAGSADHELG
jgi:hypothetical protein